MSTSSDTSLGFLRIQCKQQADLENNAAVSDAEWNAYISNSYKRLYAMLVAAYGNNYFLSSFYQFTLGSSQFVSLPDGTPNYIDANGNQATKFFKLIEVDLQYSSSPSGWVTLKRFEDIERNKYANPNTAINWNGYSNLRYGIYGNQLMFVPIPQSGQTCRIRYIPAPTNLQFSLPGYSVSGSTVIGSMSDTTGVTSGMNIFSYQPNIISPNITVTSVSTSTMTISSNALSSNNANIFSMWNDAAVLDGIAGWEQYVIYDAAIKAQIKQEGPSAELMAERERMRVEIEAMAEARDAGQAFHVSDALSVNAYSGDYGFGDGQGDWGW